MKIALILFGMSLPIVVGGCDLFQTHQMPDAVYSTDLSAPAEIKIIGLTEIVTASDGSKIKNIDLYLDMRDASGSRLRFPATFRFELYEHAPRTAQRRGKRIHVWPDMDLMDQADNDSHWRDHLNAYFFQLDIDFALPVGQSFILYVTAITEHGKRMNAGYDLKNL